MKCQDSLPTKKLQSAQLLLQWKAEILIYMHLKWLRMDMLQHCFRNGSLALN